MTKAWLDLLNEMIKDGFVSERVHPDYPSLKIYNYTPKCQYDGTWNEVTTTTRGLVLDYSNPIPKCVARPFKKFFTIEQHKDWLKEEFQVPLNTPFHIYEKWDGSLIILFFYNNKWLAASRGSFESPQAKKAIEWINSTFPTKDLDIAYTYLYEIIYPENRIVVDYGNINKLELLAMIKTETGEEINLAKDVLGNNDKVLTCVGDFDRLLNNIILLPFSEEGFVIKFDDKDNTRIKVKREEYLKKHRLIFGCSNVTIWEMMRDGRTLEEITKHFYYPDLINWAKNIYENLLLDYYRIERYILARFVAVFIDVKFGILTRKEAAEIFLRESNNTHISFLYLDFFLNPLLPQNSDNIRKAIFKAIKPEIFRLISSRGS